MLKTFKTKIEFRGKVVLKNKRTRAKFKAFLTEQERKDLFDFIQALHTEDMLDFVYYEN